MIITAEVSELTRKIKLPTDRVLSVNGDYQVDGIAFKLPATYEGDFDFSTAAARVHWTGVDKVEHTNLITEVDGNGYPLWIMPSELTQGGHGVIELAVSFVATDETAAVTKRWISDPVSFRNRRTVSGSNEDEEAEEEKIYERLASAIAAVRAAQASVDDVAEVLSSLGTLTFHFVDAKADMTDQTKLYVLTTDGYLYYYSTAASDFVPAFEVGGSQEVIDARTDENGTTYANLKTRINTGFTQLKEDLSAEIARATAEISFSGSDITCGWEIGAYKFSNGNKINFTTRIRTKGYIDASIKHISADTDHAEFGLLAYDANGTYVGCWNGSQLTTSTAWIVEADLNVIGTYNYKISVRDKNDSSKDIDVEYATYLSCNTNVGYAAFLVDQCFRGELLVSSIKELSHFDNAVINRYYSINSTAIPGGPVADKGHLLYFGLKGGNTTPSSGREMQIFAADSGGLYYRYNRFSSGAPWSDWYRIAIVGDVPDSIMPSMSMFESFGVIGDSFASGEIYDSTSETHADYYALSWGQVIARMCGNTCVNYSTGGLTTQTWLTSAYGLTKLNAETANNLYVIALGINDANILGTARLGTIADIVLDDIDSFFSYYGRIIRAIKAHAPNAIIMLSTLARTGTVYNQYSAAVREIGAFYGFAVLDLAISAFFSSTFFTTHQIHNHPTAVNYSAMAKEYRNLIETAMEENASLYDGYVG